LTEHNDSDGATVKNYNIPYGMLGTGKTGVWVQGWGTSGMLCLNKKGMGDAWCASVL